MFDFPFRAKGLGHRVLARPGLKRQHKARSVGRPSKATDPGVLERQFPQFSPGRQIVNSCLTPLKSLTRRSVPEPDRKINWRKSHRDPVTTWRELEISDPESSWVGRELQVD
jgi:hypothetical protein